MQSFFTPHPKSRRFAAVGAASVGVLLLAACSASNTPAPSGSGGDAGGGDQLVVASILPQTGNLEFLGPPEFAGVNLAVKDLEAAGYPFTIEHLERDSGDPSSEIATQSTTEALKAGADVVVGAAASGVSLNIIDQIVGAKVVMISPANTAPEFSEYKDGGFYFRTAPSDVLQGRVLGNYMVSDGAATIGFITMNDAYGKGLQQNAQTAVEGAGGEVVANELYNPNDTNFQGVVRSVVDKKPDAIAVIGFAEAAQIIPELVTNGFPAAQMYFVDGSMSNSFEFDPGTLEGAQGTIPGNPAADGFRKRLLEVDPDLDDFTYGPESYDATVLAALAAANGGKPDAATIRDNLQKVSAEGEKCTEVAACLKLIEAGTDIDYDGPSGPITFDENGDPTEAYIGIYKYGNDNKYTFEKSEFGSLSK